MFLLIYISISIECGDGYHGPNCIIPCRYPNYGRECQEKCHCQENTCNFVTGCLMYGEKSHLQIHKSMHTYTYCTFTNSSSPIQRQLHLHHMTFSYTREIATCPIYTKQSSSREFTRYFSLKIYVISSSSAIHMKIYMWNSREYNICREFQIKFTGSSSELF